MIFLDDFCAWRVVSTSQIFCFTVPCWWTITSNSFFKESSSRFLSVLHNFFWGFARTSIFASLCRNLCGTSVAHSIRVMRTCLRPNYSFLSKDTSLMELIWMLRKRFNNPEWVLLNIHSEFHGIPINSNWILFILNVIVIKDKDYVRSRNEPNISQHELKTAMQHLYSSVVKGI